MTAFMFQSAARNAQGDAGFYAGSHGCDIVHRRDVRYYLLARTDC